MKTYRVDSLGRETVFHVVTGLLPPENERAFKRLLTKYALGYTRHWAIGGWRGEEEEVAVYRVASLTDSQVNHCIQFLLDHSEMRDVYVVHSDGIARGHCYEERETWNYTSIPFPAYAGVPDRNKPVIDPKAPRI